MIYLDDRDFTLYHGDVLKVGPTLPKESIQCVVTSPPYYGLRDYGTGKWVYEGKDSVADAEVVVACTHEAAKKKTRYDYSLATSGIQDGSRRGTDAQVGMWKEICPDCGARRVDDQLGAESTPDEFIRRMADVFEALRPALAADATLFVNLGDTYKDGSPLMVPQRFAIEMRDRGFFLFNEVIWAKPNTMPESVKRRFTKAHEHIYCFGNSADYKFIQQFEDQTIDRHVRWVEKGEHSIQHRAGDRWPNENGRNMRDWWAIAPASYADAHFAVFPPEIPKRCIAAGTDEGDTVLDPFMGSGTTARIARAMGRKAVGIELNEEYCRQIARNTEQQSLFSIEEVA